MKTNILFLFLFLGLITQAQNQKNKHIKALKTAFITDKLDLSTREAEKFWPLYNGYSKEKFKLKRLVFNKNIDLENLTENESQEKLQNLFKLEAKLYQNKIKFYSDLKEILSAKKILLLIRAEKEFNKKLLKQLKQPK